MSELADRLENVLNGLENLRDNAQIRDDKYDFGYIGAMIDEQKEAIAALRAEPVAWTAHGIKREDTCVWVQDSDGPWNTSCGKVFEFTNDGPAENEANFCYHCGGALLPEPYSDASPSREQDQRGGKSGETPDLEGLKVQSTPHLTASPARLSAEQVENARHELHEGITVSSWVIDRLCDAALSSLTARSDGIEAAANVCRKELDDCPSTPRLFDRGYACACENLMERISALKEGK